VVWFVLQEPVRPEYSSGRCGSCGIPDAPGHGSKVGVGTLSLVTMAEPASPLEMGAEHML